MLLARRRRRRPRWPRSPASRSCSARRTSSSSCRTPACPSSASCCPSSRSSPSEAGLHDGGHQRRALPAPRGRLRARRAALHPDAEQPRRREPHALRQRRVLPQVGRGDGRALRRLPRGLRPPRSRSPSAATSSSTSATTRCRAYPVPEGYTEDAYLRELCEAGHRAPLRRRARPGGASSASTSSSASSARWASTPTSSSSGTSSSSPRTTASPWAPAAARPPGRIVSYALGITDIDPLKYDLLFERFLNPGRKSMPDIDMDFSVERRERGHRLRGARSTAATGWRRSSPSAPWRRARPCATPRASWACPTRVGDKHRQDDPRAGAAGHVRRGDEAGRRAQAGLRLRRGGQGGRRPARMRSRASSATTPSTRPPW